MRTVLLLLLAIIATPGFANEVVWKWVDDKGVTHYSDRPVPGATKVELNVGSRWDAGGAPPSSPVSSGAAQPAGPAQAVYRNFEIWKPTESETIANTGGQVTVNVRVDPALQANHRLHLYLDGQIVTGFAPNAESYDLKDVSRGTHSVTAVITDSRGNRVQESRRVMFTVRQESVAQPPVGPTLRPPPKPRPSGAANKLPTTQPSYSTLNGARRPINPSTNAPVGSKPAPAPKGPKEGG